MDNHGNDDKDGNGELVAWLAQQPAGATLRIGDDQLYLQTGDGGAVLGGLLGPHDGTAQLEQALQQGFASALQFEAGLALSADATQLVLSRWLPAVRDWRGAAPALPQLLDQLDYWRTMLAPPAHAPALERPHERRMRQALAAKALRS